VLAQLVPAVMVALTPVVAVVLQHIPSGQAVMVDLESLYSNTHLHPG
jgi:hypothetical protein